MASSYQQPTQIQAGRSAYKRASRKNAARKFHCEYPGCDKIYSRAEHLQRHQLNHSPKQIYECEVESCGQKFVRHDLLARHRNRHSSSYTPRNRVPSFNISTVAESLAVNRAASPPLGLGRGRESLLRPTPNMPHDAAVLLTSDAGGSPALSSIPPGPAPEPPWSSPMSHAIIQPKPEYYSRDTHLLQQPPPVMPFTNVHFPPDAAVALARDNFAMWLFDPQPSYEFSVAHLPFLEGGLESPFNSNIHHDYESLTSRSQLETPPRLVDTDELLTEFRRQEVLHFFQAFRAKQPKCEPLITNLVQDGGGDMPMLDLEMMRDCLREFWERVSHRLPVIHQPTFSCNRCPILLLLVMVALGATSLRSRDRSGKLSDYGAFADVIITGARWEILTVEEASPPVALWVAQALLLLEFYEKLYSSRKLHERSHIYHSATLTLLRRGSPLIGRSGSESPPGEFASGLVGDPSAAGLDSRTWWVRWAETEAMHRAVFAAFSLDVIHAAMFGHASDMAPHEIRLPLPCDDNLWTASKPEDVRQLDANLRMYGVKPVSFLDGLKRALHGKEVKTHSFGRMIIMSGLLSVGWHFSHRETHLKWLDLTTPSNETRDNWRKVLLKAFDDWKGSYDAAQGMLESSAASAGQRGGSNGPIEVAAVLYHLAHLSLHVDIVDAQVYSGARRLLGRKVSSRDYTNVVSRMQGWAALSSTRHAVLHAFKLLYGVLVDPRKTDRRRHTSSTGANTLPSTEARIYSCYNEQDPHRPWILYYAALSIWSFVRALSATVPYQQTQPQSSLPGVDRPNSYRRVVNYLANVATMSELSEPVAINLADGLPELLDYLQVIFSESQFELLKEAHNRLKVCREMLVHGG
ncbi:uncharacterized protein E0L32_001856 [Thyridium curvatum]|uniref:C2H2-type domain-containing protein n=1 Tax=Thyridium curvatum TaxID=1093900 RepID=A0A507ATP8_9PEZI|nr:uncharacterized protein E0L32_001823 [Thyridium curvatum]XP_030989992.1 uncharacterized protein E0L32_001856 [Thyridium curvatum]TPX08248.1 hypothetical protein E0L32_001823 [Thyridium curvatum]TPX08281.1 hypothetical protein E0L32_001856 [Thyridium curvatum]